MTLLTLSISVYSCSKRLIWSAAFGKSILAKSIIFLNNKDHSFTFEGNLIGRKYCCMDSSVFSLELWLISSDITRLDDSSSSPEYRDKQLVFRLTSFCWLLPFNFIDKSGQIIFETKFALTNRFTSQQRNEAEKEYLINYHLRLKRIHSIYLTIDEYTK